MLDKYRGKLLHDDTITIYFTFHGPLYLLNILHALDILNFQLSLVMDGRDYLILVIPLLAFLLILRGNFLQRQICITFHLM